MMSSELGRNGRFLLAFLDLLARQAPETYALFLTQLNGVVAQFRLGNEWLWVFPDYGRKIAVAKRLPEVAVGMRVNVRVRPETLLDLIEGQVKPLDALHRGEYDVIGAPEPVMRLSRGFALLLQRALALPSFRLLYRDYKSGQPEPRPML
jgi:hypothetical protein